MSPLERWTKRVNLLEKLGDTEAKYEKPLKKLTTIYCEVVSPLGNMVNNLRDLGGRKWMKKYLWEKKKKRR